MEEARGYGSLSEREVEIVRSAYRTVARRGPDRTSLRDIADDAGVSKALLLYHFGSKDELLLASMKWALERTERRIRERLAGNQAGDRISALVEAIFIGPEANRQFYLFYLDLVQQVARVPKFVSLASMLDDIINGLYTEVIAAGVAEGAFDVSDVAEAAREMRAVIEGTFVQWLQTADWRTNHDRWKQDCRHALLRLLGVATPAAPSKSHLLG